MSKIALRASTPGRLAAAATFLGLGMGLARSPAAKREAQNDGDKPADEAAANQPKEGDAPAPGATATQADGTAPPPATPPAPGADAGTQAPTQGAAKGKRCEGCDCDPEDPECDDAEMRGETPIAHARTRERARCAAIFAHPNAAANPAFAAQLAFATSLTRAEALALMESAPAAATAGPTGLSARMAQERQPNLGPGGQPAGGEKAQAGAWDNAIGRVAKR